MRFVRLPLDDLRRRPVRTGLTAAGIAIAVASFVALVGLSRGLEHAWVRSLAERGTHLLATRKGAVEILTASVDESAGGTLGRLAGVREVAGELVDLATLDTGETVLVAGWPPGSYLWQTVRLAAGRLPEPGARDAVVLGQALAEALGRGPGSKLVLRGRDLTVTGVVRTAGVINGNMLMMPLPALQALLDRPGKVTVFGLRLERPDDPAAVAGVLARAATALPDLTVTEARLVADQNDVLRLLRAMTWGTSTVALVMGLVLVLNTLLMAVTERTREIGVLAAVGWSRSRIVALVTLEGVLLAAGGGALGAALGVGGLAWLTRAPAVRGFLDPEVSVRLVLEVAVATLALGVLGSAYPAWRAARLAPVDALRHE